MELVRVCVFFSLVMLLLMGCSVAMAPKKSEAIYWPKPPDSPRFIYETSLRSTSSIRQDTSLDRLRDAVTGTRQTTQQSFAKPYDVAAYGGKIVVTDTVARSAIMFDVPRKRVYPFGARGDGKGKGVIVKPLGVAMDSKQNIYIADVTERDVKVYDGLGLFLRSIGGQEVFERPVDVAVNRSGDRVYVVDAGGIESDQHRILVFDAEGSLVNEIGSRGSALGKFNLPNQAAVAPDGTLYVLDAGNFRVQAFTPDGEFIRSWGKVGRNLGDFARPRGIAVDSGGNVYVTDGAFRNFQVFSPDGEMLLFIGEPGLDDRPGQYVLPAGIAIDETDRVYIVDQMHFKVDVIRRLKEEEVDRLAAQKAETTAKPVSP
ncbi:MAG: 6-bladed beta-propeller [Gammaproteobacteria bacterium]|nr:6-bladed beta-propeller [Gammaproteobacteria bacterium]